MKRSLVVTAAVAVAALVVAARAWSQEKPAYTPQEYNAYTACANDKNAQTRAKCLEDFVAKFPESTLLPYVYRLQYLTQYEVKNFAKTVEYADKLLSLGDKLEFGSKLEALVARAQAFYLGQNLPALTAPQQLNKTRQAAQEGLKVVAQWQKPEQITEQQYEQQKRSFNILFNSIDGVAALALKDYKGAVESFKVALAIDAGDALNNYRIGVSYLQMDPPQPMDGFWALARSVVLKIPSESQVREYIRRQMLRYQGTLCEKEIEAQVNELLTLAAASSERPANYTIPSAADLDAIRQAPGEWLATLKTGGEPAKKTWLALCGLEFPEIGGKVIEVASGNDSVVLRIYTGADEKEVEAATTPNMELHVVGQPRAANFQKDNYLRFKGTLAGYSPDPFMVKWDKVEVFAEDLPEEKAQAPAKAPAKKAPAKRPAKRPPPR